MKIQPISDIHVEFHSDAGKKFISNLPVLGDVLVVAGDLGVYNLLEHAIGELCLRFPQVVYVTGNHEYYGSSFKAVDGILTKLQDKLPNFHWLNDSSVTIDGQRFVGTTLWFEYSLKAIKYQSCLNDFMMIKGFNPEVFTRNEAAKKYLDQTVGEEDVVVTHHIPSYKCVHPKYKFSIMNFYFVTELYNLIADRSPKLILHGHGHNFGSMNIGSTGVICNPVGYPHEISRFDKSLVIEV